MLKGSTNDTFFKIARNGVITFCVIHFLFEIAIGNQKFAAASVFINYAISAWYIKRKITTGKPVQNLFIFGLSVSGVVFGIRLLLGFLLFNL